ncbi:MAG: hypothetical protein H8E49_00345, partial [Gammaproteobacteria bacterium]|nr:hypothetical protein [Gammaproteobacteria bacterium]
MTETVYLEVALPTPVRQTFTYSAASELGPFPVGIRVLVPFGRRTMIGIVLNTASETTYPAEKLKSIGDKLDSTPIISPILIRLCLWASDYYHHPIGEVFSTALPTLLRTGKSASQQLRVLELTSGTTTVWTVFAAPTLPPQQICCLHLIAKRYAAETDTQ